EEVDVLRELLAGRLAQPCDALRILPRVERDDVVHGLEAGGHLLLALGVEDERAVADAVEKPDVSGRDMLGELPRGAGLLVRPVVPLVVGNRLQHSGRGRSFTIENVREIVSQKPCLFGSHRHLRCKHIPWYDVCFRCLRCTTRSTWSPISNSPATRRARSPNWSMR